MKVDTYVVVYALQRWYALRKEVTKNMPRCAITGAIFPLQKKLIQGEWQGQPAKDVAADIQRLQDAVIASAFLSGYNKVGENKGYNRGVSLASIRRACRTVGGNRRHNKSKEADGRVSESFLLKEAQVPGTKWTPQQIEAFISDVMKNAQEHAAASKL